MANVPEVLRLRKFRVQEIVWETPEIYTLRLVPVEGESKLVFKAGQWVYLHLLNEDGTTWKAAFSIATAPSDTCPLELGVKIEKDFTKRASKLRIDDVVALQGPFGVFVLPNEVTTPIVFIAGGIGITPFRSMMREMVHQKMSAPMRLVYSNRYCEDSAYLEEFDDLERAYGPMTMLATLTGEKPPGWTGKTGRVDAAMLAPLLAETAATGQFFMCGPNPFMDSIRLILEQAGVDKKRIHQERFD